MFTDLEFHDHFDSDWYPREPDVDLVALQSLRDCGVVRTQVGNRRFLELYDEGFAEIVRTDGPTADYRITAAGKRFLEKMNG